MKNKWLIIGIAIMVITIGILACDGREVSTPTEPVPVQMPPAVANEPVPTGVVKVTAEELVKQLLTNPNRYKKGIIMQVSGTVLKPGDYVDQGMGLINSFTLGPIIEIAPYVHGFVSISAWTSDVKKGTNWDNIELVHVLDELNNGDWVVIRGEFGGWNPNDKWRKEARIENVSLISVTFTGPASTAEITEPVVGPSGEVEITAARLLKDLLANPTKYQEGTIMQVSGRLIISPGGYFSLGPVVNNSLGKELEVNIATDEGVSYRKQTLVDIERTLLSALRKLNEGDWVVVRGEVKHYAGSESIYIDNPSFISAIPAK